MASEIRSKDDKKRRFFYRIASYDKGTPESNQKKIKQILLVKSINPIKRSNDKKGVDISHLFLYFRRPLLQERMWSDGLERNVKKKVDFEVRNKL